ncbi:hypothetical protein PGT21_026419 [Puccinia graminis f. sp. tritici]|uniref:Uncharacterized protein n=1 Tax=Puccinia graminis f. sp. tritici TaxID=56615 RepID=A0A5B0R2A8_PUCGR|nr:hypothetical protein PGT21_026419 [Puccinia graminis f. sp. tritici]
MFSFLPAIFVFVFAYPMSAILAIDTARSGRGSFASPNYPKDARSDSRLRTQADCSPLPGLPILKDKSLSWTINLNPESLSAINQTNWRPEMSTAAIFAETQNDSPAMPTPLWILVAISTVFTFTVLLN